MYTTAQPRIPRVPPLSGTIAMATSTARTRLALNTAPLVLRIMLGVVMLWAGLAKILDTAEVSGDRAATLANMGLFAPPPKPPAAPANSGQPAGTHQMAPTPAAPAPTPGHYTGADFPDPVKVQRLYLLALSLYDAANPKAAEAPAAAAPPAAPTGAPTPPPAPAPAAAPMPTWHPALANGPWPIYFAWGVATIEAAGGACLILGFLTRFWALGITIVMLGAIWLTHIGPAIQSGHTRWGFLPDFAPFDTNAWHPLLYHFLLMMSALALTLAGPGRASLDRALFGPKGE
jgi:uncharacterized membrane protein YphA (DoxX/SURF4 family)